MLNRVATCQGNVREKQNFLQVWEKSRNFEKMSGNFDHMTHVRELRMNSNVATLLKILIISSGRGIGSFSISLQLENRHQIVM